VVTTPEAAPVQPEGGIFFPGTGRILKTDRDLYFKKLMVIQKRGARALFTKSLLGVFGF